VVSHGIEIQRRAIKLNGRARPIIHRLAFSKAVSRIGIGARAKYIGIKTVSRVDVEVAKKRLLCFTARGGAELSVFSRL